MKLDWKPRNERQRETKREREEERGKKADEGTERRAREEETPTQTTLNRGGTDRSDSHEQEENYWWARKENYWLVRKESYWRKENYW